MARFDGGGRPAACRTSSRAGKLPVLVGGTGLYLDALVRGTDVCRRTAAGGAVRQASAAAAGSRRASAALLAELAAVDPETAPRGSILRDEKRILRALEVYRETGETITAARPETPAAPAPLRRRCTSA